MAKWGNIRSKILLFEIVVNDEKQDVRLWVASFNKGEVHFEQKTLNTEVSLDKWKYRIAILSITGDPVVSKLYKTDDASIKKITENEELFWSVTPSGTDEELIVSFLRKDSVKGLLDRLEKSHIYVLDKWIGKSGTFDKEKYVSEFLHKEMNLSAVSKTPGRIDVICNMLYYRLRLLVLLLFFFLLLGNFLINTQLRKEYETVQTELNMKQRTDKIYQENQKKQGRIQAEYQKIPDCSFALIADRIASYVPTNVRLNLLSIFPLENNGAGMANRTKGLKLSTKTVVVKGEVEIPGSITLFAQFLSSDKLFSKVEILSLVRQKDSPIFNFELSITL